MVLKLPQSKPKFLLHSLLGNDWSTHSLNDTSQHRRHGFEVLSNAAQILSAPLACGIAYMKKDSPRFGPRFGPQVLGILGVVSLGTNLSVQVLSK